MKSVSQCYSVNFVSPPKTYVLKPNPQCDGGRRLGPRELIRSQGQGLYKWDQCPEERGPRELPCLFHHVRIQQKGAICEPGNQPSSDTKPASALTSDCLSPRTVRNRCFWFKPPVCGILSQQLKWSKTLLRNCPTTSQSGCTILHSHQQRRPNFLASGSTFDIDPILNFIFAALIGGW